MFLKMSENNLISINNEVVEYFDAKELEFNLNYESLEKLNRIKNFFEILEVRIEKRNIAQDLPRNPRKGARLDHEMIE